MSEAPVLLTIKDNIAQITLNRPQNRNSMDEEVMPAFLEKVNQVGEEKDVRCVVIAGTGKSFCAGADFKSNRQEKFDLLPHERLLEIYEPFLKIGEIKVPTIGALNGHAIGGGFGLALICDIRVANKDAKYGANFARLGLHSGMAVSYMLPRLVGLPKANELLFTGRLINGTTAAGIGLANYAVDEAEVLPKAMKLAEEIAACAPAAVRMMKQSVYRGIALNPPRGCGNRGPLPIQKPGYRGCKGGDQRPAGKAGPSI